MRTFAASYHIPYIAHVPLEPRAAVAEWDATGNRILVDQYFDGYGAGNGVPLTQAGVAAKPGLCPEIRFYTNDSWGIIRGVAAAKGFPMLLMNRYSRGTLYLWTMPENFGDLYNLPQPMLTRIKEYLFTDSPVRIDAPPHRLAVGVGRLLARDDADVFFGGELALPAHEARERRVRDEFEERLCRGRGLLEIPRIATQQADNRSAGDRGGDFARCDRAVSLWRYARAISNARGTGRHRRRCVGAPCRGSALARRDRDAASAFRWPWNFPRGSARTQP